MTSGPRPVRAPRGTSKSAKGWGQEAALRMLQNNLDPEVAEHPDKLVVYGGTGKAARNWASFDALVKTLSNLEDDETMLVQSGKPVGVFRTHEWAPRVLLANSNLVGDWANWPEFRRLEDLGLTMYGQMTAGSWIYIGTQGILQGTYETFAAVAEKHFGGTLAGTLTVTGGCGGMGGAQPLAITMNEGTCLIIDVDGSRLARRLKKRYLDEIADNLEDAVARATKARTERRAVSIGLVGNSATILPKLYAMGVPVDIVTDQTSAHDPLFYIPEGVDVEGSRDLAAKDPVDFSKRSKESMAKQIPSGMKHVKVDTNEPLNSQDLSLHIYVRSSARVRVHLDGLHSLEMRKIFTEQIRQYSISSLRISISIAGSRWLKTALNLKDSPPVSVGLVMANAIKQVLHLMISLHEVKSALRLLLVATIWIAEVWHLRIVNQKLCTTGQMQLRIGHCSMR